VLQPSSPLSPSFTHYLPCSDEGWTALNFAKRRYYDDVAAYLRSQYVVVRISDHIVTSASIHLDYLRFTAGVPRLQQRQDVMASAAARKHAGLESFSFLCHHSDSDKEEIAWWCQYKDVKHLELMRQYILEQFVVVRISDHIFTSTSMRPDYLRNADLESLSFLCHHSDKRESAWWCQYQDVKHLALMRPYLEQADSIIPETIANGNSFEDSTKAQLKSFARHHNIRFLDSDSKSNIIFKIQRARAESKSR
jgi:hypothetical protein